MHQEEWLDWVRLRSNHGAFYHAVDPAMKANFVGVTETVLTGSKEVGEGVAQTGSVVIEGHRQSHSDVGRGRERVGDPSPRDVDLL